MKNFFRISIAALVTSLLIVIVFLALGITTITIPAGLFVYASLIIFGTALVAAELSRTPNCSSQNTRWFLHLNAITIYGIILIIYVLILAQFLVITVAIIGLISFWILLFLFLALIFTVLFITN